MTPDRRFVPVVLGLALALASLKLLACGFVDPNPPIPWEVSEGDQADPADASDASEEAR